MLCKTFLGIQIDFFARLTSNKDNGFDEMRS